MGLFLLAGFGAANVFLPLYIVPKFEQIYADALPGRALPGTTTFIIAAQIPLAVVAVGWPVAGIIAAWRQHRATFWIINLGYLYFIFKSRLRSLR